MEYNIKVMKFLYTLRSCACVLVALMVVATFSLLAHEAHGAPEGYIYEWSTLIVLPEAESAEGVANEDASEEEETPEHFFIYFAGSDWCPHCMRFEEDVIDNPTFRRYLEDNFVPVLIDSPRYYELSEEQSAYNEIQRTKYEITGFPTIIVADAEGEIVERLGYGREGANRFIRTLRRAIR